MRAFGITGGIGAGKSLISRIFHVLGVPVFDADMHARELTNTSPEVSRAIQGLFGPESYTSGRLDRAMVAKIVFHDPDKLQRLNQIIHPAVAHDFQGWLAQQQAPYVLKEAALLYETGAHKALEGIIVVDAPEPLRIDRVLHRDPQRDESQIRAIIQQQMDSKKKVEMADFVIVNDGQVPVIPQVFSVHQQICG